MLASRLAERTKIAAATVALLLAAAAPRPARADGGTPQSYSIVLPTDRPQEIALGTSFGLVISDDGGANWFWTCEQAQTASGFQYLVGPPPRDRLYSLSPTEGLALSDDGSCSWQLAGGALAQALATDFFVNPSDADDVLAVAAPYDPSGSPLPQSVFRSSDGGATFGATPIYTAPAETDLIGVEIARSDPQTIYLAMYDYASVTYHPYLVRSSDGGATWTTLDVQPSLGSNMVRILAVDPDDANRVYLRVIAPGLEQVAVTTDGGATFSIPLQLPNGAVSAFARLASGTILVAALNALPGGATAGGGYRSTDGGATWTAWTLCPQPHIIGLAERDGILYLAAREFSDGDGWALATSTDEGATIVPLAGYEEVRGVKACQPAPDCSAACQIVGAQGVWTNDVCSGALLDGGVVPPRPTLPACMPDGGASDAGPSHADSGCGCAATSPRGGGLLPAVAVLIAIAISLARRSSRRPQRRSAEGDRLDSPEGAV